MLRWAIRNLLSFSVGHRVRKARRRRFGRTPESLEQRVLMAADATFLPAEFRVAAVADMDGNGSIDYVIQRNLDGSAEAGKGKIIFMDGNRQLRTADISQPGDPWKDIRIAGAGDFNRDGEADLVFELLTSGDKGIWQMNGAQRTEQTWIGRPSDSPKFYSIGGVGDFNGDGRPDLALNYSPSGDKTIWVMNGLQRMDAYWVPRPSDSPKFYQIVAAGDFNGDRIADLVLEFSPNGSKTLWLMRGPNVRDGALWLTSPTDGLNRTSYVGAADINFDGKTDLVAYHPDARDLVGLYMNGTTRYEAMWIGRHAVDVTRENGVLTITGTSQTDDIAINPMNGGVMVVANGTYDYFLGGSISQIVVNALAGDDTVRNNTTVRSTMYGGDGRDTLQGGSGADWLYGDSGDDVLYGNNGNDVLFGGVGSDSLAGGIGSDSTIQEDIVSYDHATGTIYVTGTEGADDLQIGDANSNLIVRRSGQEIAFLAAGGLRLSQIEMHGFGGNDSLRNDTSLPSKIYGDAGRDTLFGGSAVDWMYGGTEDDVLYGNYGNDVLFGGAGNDSLAGGIGSDSTIQDDNVSYDPATGTVFVIGTPGDDDLQIGDANSNLIVRRSGQEIAFLVAGGLRLSQIEMHGFGGNDSLRNDTSLPSKIYGDAGRDTLFGGSAGDWMYGGTEDDVLYGNNGNDVLFGGAGSDSLAGGIGSDSTIQDDNVTYDSATESWIVHGIPVGNTVQVGDIGDNITIRVGTSEVAFLAAGGVQPRVVVLRFTNGEELSLGSDGVLRSARLGTLADGAGGLIRIFVDAQQRVWFVDRAGNLARSWEAWGGGGFTTMAQNVVRLSIAPDGSMFILRKNGDLLERGEADQDLRLISTEVLWMARTISGSLLYFRRGVLFGEANDGTWQPLLDINNTVTSALDSLKRWVHPIDGEMTPWSYVVVDREALFEYTKTVITATIEGYLEGGPAGAQKEVLEAVLEEGAESLIELIGLTIEYINYSNPSQPRLYLPWQNPGGPNAPGFDDNMNNSDGWNDPWESLPDIIDVYGPPTPPPGDVYGPPSPPPGEVYGPPTPPPDGGRQDIT